jgi:NAD-dependent SIR2 family protein deacetylase
MKDEYLSKMKQIILEADAILITAGAGMGVDSGLPDFRGDKGLWEAYPPVAKLGLSFSDIANPKLFISDPALAWAFYGHRFNLYRHTVPHEGFGLLLDLVQKKNDNYFIFTSNVDGQFQKAGFDDEKIVEVHGSIHYWQCAQYCKKEIWEADTKDMKVDMETFQAIDLPLCPYCGEVARPNILMFWDWKWLGRRVTKQEARYNKWRKSIRKTGQKLAIIEIGAGTVIPTIRQEGSHLAKLSEKIKLIRINPREYETDEKYGFSVPYGGLEGLKMILDIKKT